MKKTFNFLLAALIGLSVITNFTACSKDKDIENIVENKDVETGDVLAQKVSVSPDKVEIIIGGTIQLTALVLPTDTKDKAITWTSSDASLASVDVLGLVTTHKAGSVVVTATTTNKISATVVILIKDKPDPNAFVDKDGRVYKTALINGKYWMLENLAYLPSVFPAASTSDDMARNYVYGYDGNDVKEAMKLANFTKYGVLYNWQAAVDACPKGWHLPSDREWKDFEISMGMNPIVADKIGLEYYTGFYRGDADMAYSLMTENAWGKANTTNTTGFSALPAGILDGGFSFLGKVTHFWTSTSKNKESFFRGLVCFNVAKGIMRNFAPNQSGFSVRYVQGDAEDNTYIPVESIKLAPREISLEIGETAILTCSVMPTDATDKSLSFATVGEEVATVDEMGTITAVGTGMVSIIVTSLDNSAIRTTCLVTVKDKADPNMIPTELIGTWMAFDVNETIMGQTYYGTDSFDYDPDAPYSSDQREPVHREFKGRFVFTFNKDNSASVNYTPKNGNMSTIKGKLVLKDAEKKIYTANFESEDIDIKSTDIRLDLKYETDHRVHMFINSLSPSEDNCVELLFRKNM